MLTDKLYYFLKNFFSKNDQVYVTKPFLPPLIKLYPYFRRIWETGVITNSGPIHEELESELLSVYLPKQLSDNELTSVIVKVIKDTKAESIRDMSNVMKVLKEDFGAQCDFQKASKIVKEKLSKNSN